MRKSIGANFLNHAPLVSPSHAQCYGSLHMLHQHQTEAGGSSTGQLWPAVFDLHRCLSCMKHSGPSFHAKCLNPLTAQKWYQSPHKCFGRVFSRTGVQTILHCRTHPSLPPVEEFSPSLPLGNDPCPKAAGALCSPLR